jgi:hypothetical protein
MVTVDWTAATEKTPLEPQTPTIHINEDIPFAQLVAR